MMILGKSLHTMTTQLRPERGGETTWKQTISVGPWWPGAKVPGNIPNSPLHSFGSVNKNTVFVVRN